MQATHRALININPILTQAARTTHISPYLQSGVLISIGKICDDGFIGNFTATHLNVVKDGLTVLEGNRSNTSGMWKVYLTSNPKSSRSPQDPRLLVTFKLFILSNTSGMWKVYLTSNPKYQPSKQQPSALNALEIIINPDLAKWYHTDLFIPVKKILLQSVKNVHFTTWTNLSVELKRNLPPSMATAKGHMK